MTDQEKDYLKSAGAGAAIGAGVIGAGSAAAYAAPRVATAKAAGKFADKAINIVAGEGSKVYTPGIVNEFANKYLGATRLKDIRNIKPFNDTVNKKLDEAQNLAKEVLDKKTGSKEARNVVAAVKKVHGRDIENVLNKTIGSVADEAVRSKISNAKLGSKAADLYINKVVKPNAVKAGIKGGLKGIAAGALGGVLYKTFKDGARKVKPENYYVLDKQGNVVNEFNNRDSALSLAQRDENLRINKGTTLLSKGVTNAPVPGNTFGNNVVAGYRNARDNSGMRMMNYSFIGDFIERDLAGGAASVAASGAAKKLGSGIINQLIAGIGGYVAGYREMGKRQQAKERLTGEGYFVYPNKYYITCITDGKPDIELYEINGYDDKHSVNLAMSLTKPNKTEHLSIAIGKDLLKTFPKIFKLAKY